METAGLVPSNIFLTGATGVLGGHLLKELLATTDATLYCLVRAGSPALGAERLREFLSVYDPRNELEDVFNRRVVPVVGDLTRPHLGLEAYAYRELVSRIEAVVHAAALTNLFLSFRRIEPINVGGTRNLIDFALATPSKIFCYVSTFTVMGDRTFDPDFVFSERDYDVGQGFSHMTYQHTKFIAEGMVRAAGEAGLRWNILRPGQIFGESSSGAYPHGQSNIIGLFYDIFRTVIETGVALDSATPFDVVPVDYVSRGIIELGLRPPRFFSTYHLTNPAVKTYTEVIRLVKQVGYDIRWVSQDDYRELLFGGKLHHNGAEYKSPTTSAFRWWYKRKEFDFRRGAGTDCTLTRIALAARGVTCPTLDLNLVQTYIQAGIRKGYFPSSSHPSTTPISPTRELEAVL